MKTTIILDLDVEALVKEESRRTRTSFKKVLNQAIRNSLGTAAPKSRQKKFVVKTHPLGIKPIYRGKNMNELAAQLENGILSDSSVSSKYVAVF